MQINRILRNTFLLSALFGLAGFISSCSSSTDPGQSAAISAPSTIAFGNITVGQPHDTTITITNTGTTALTLKSSVSTSGVTDTNFSAGSTLAANASQTLHIQFTPADTGVQIGYDTIHYSNGSSAYTSVIKLTANGLRAIGVGTSYTFSATSFDSTTSQSAGPSDTTYSILATNLNFAGKSNVIEMLDGSDTTYFHLEPNGDFSRYIQVGVPGTLELAGQWLIIPVASHTTQTLAFKDTTVTAQGLTATVHTVATASYIDDETITAAGTSFKTSVAKIVVKLVASAFIPVETVQITTTVYYSPALQFYVKSHVHNYYSGIQESHTTEDQSLISYTIK